MWLAFVAGSVTCVVGCATAGNRRAGNAAAGERVEVVRKGDPAPDEGFWVSRRTFLMLYEAAEKSAAFGKGASQPTARGRVEPPDPGLPAEGGQVPPAKGEPE